MFMNVLVWIVLAVSAYGFTALMLGALFSRTIELPEPSYEMNYTDGSYNTFWSEVYISNAPLRTVPFHEFIKNPQQYLHDNVLSLPVLDLDAFEPLMPEQQIKEIESYMFHVQPEVLERARRELSGEDFDSLLELFEKREQSLYQF